MQQRQYLVDDRKSGTRSRKPRTRKTPSRPLDFEATAKNMAEYIHTHWIPEHRGVRHFTDFSPSFCVAFGNDGHDRDVRSQAEVRILRELAQQDGIAELAFGVGGDGYTWCMLLDTGDIESVARLLTRAAREAWRLTNAEERKSNVDDLVDRIRARLGLG